MSDDPLQGWPIDLRALYGFLGWRTRARFHLREHAFAAPQGDVCLLLYHISEIGVGKDIGRLAVFRVQEKPQKVFDGGGTLFWYAGDSSVQWSDDGRLAFVFECKTVQRWFSSAPVRFEILLNILDLSGGRWSRWDRRLTDFLRVRRLDDRRFSLEPWKEPSPEGAPRIELDLDDLVWRNF